MYLLVLYLRFLEFRLLSSRVAPDLQFVATNCLIESLLEKLNNLGEELVFTIKKEIDNKLAYLDI